MEASLAPLGGVLWGANLAVLLALSVQEGLLLGRSVEGPVSFEGLPWRDLVLAPVACAVVWLCQPLGPVGPALRPPMPALWVLGGLVALHGLASDRGSPGVTDPLWGLVASLAGLLVRHNLWLPGEVLGVEAMVSFPLWEVLTPVGVVGYWLCALGAYLSLGGLCPGDGGTLRWVAYASACLVVSQWFFGAWALEVPGWYPYGLVNYWFGVIKLVSSAGLGVSMGLMGWSQVALPRCHRISLLGALLLVLSSPLVRW